MRSQKPPPGHRRKGYGALQLGIVIAARPFQRLGPGLVEDIFAIGMTLQIKRHQPVRHQQMRGLPARSARRRAGLFQRGEEFVSRERMRLGQALRVGQAVPARRADFRGTGDKSCRIRHLISKTASTSTATPRGSEPTPTAARACLPASPNSAAIRSLAPLATSGCWRYSGAALTNTPTFRQRTTRSRSPPHALLSCASRLMAQSCAAAWPASSGMSTPSLPTYFKAPSAMGIWPERKTRLPLMV